MPDSSATAVAASTLARFPRPSSGVSRSRSPAGVATRARMPSTPRSSMAVARTVAPSTVPKVTIRPAKLRARAITRGSSALQTSSVAAAARCRISALASAMASGDAKKPRCASPTFVHTRTSGSAISTSLLISPAWFIPSSITATSGLARSCISDSGRPMWLFRFPLFFTTRKRVASSSAIVSFVVVLPALPVIAITRVSAASRTACARSCSARNVSATSMTPLPSPRVDDRAGGAAFE